MAVKDIPITECVLDCARLVRLGIEVHQKWTCSHCGTRQTMEKPNTMFYSGNCEQCGKLTSITECGYMVIGPTEVILKELGKRND